MFVSCFYSGDGKGNAAKHKRNTLISITFLRFLSMMAGMLGTKTKIINHIKMAKFFLFKFFNFLKLPKFNSRKKFFFLKQNLPQTQTHI